jgi:site-specific recombinase XerD
MPPHRATAFSPADPPRFLSQAEVRAFFEVIENVRDRALFGLIYLYGLRVSEATRRRVKDLDLLQRRILIRRAKGGIWGIRPLFGSATGLLAAYFAQDPPGTPETPLFPGQRGALQKRRIQQLFTRYARSAGLTQDATCHSLRHAIATHLLDAGESLEFVKEHLGHQKIENTALYARVSNPARERAFARLERSPAIVHPRAPRALRTSVRSRGRAGGASGRSPLGDSRRAVEAVDPGQEALT